MFPYPTKAREASLQGRTCSLSTAHFFHFAAKCCLAIKAESDRKVQTGSNMAQNHHGWPFCRMVSRELIAEHHILLGVAPKKGARFFPQQAVTFLSGVRGPKKWHDWSLTFAYKMCSLVHPEPIIGCRDMPISRFRGTTEHQKSKK
jgi:hypothetical protein